MNYIRNGILILILTIFTLIFLASIFIRPSRVEAFDDKFTEDIQIIGCINTKTLEVKQPKQGTCYHGENWQNIMLPPKQHLEKWREVFKNDNQIINRLPIVNFESGFNENAGNDFAYGYVQTLRSYEIAPEIIPQLEWMRDRQESQKNGNCSHRSYSEEAMMRCLYNRHYGMTTHYNWYSNKAIIVRQFYLDYLK